jgi:hypothetical protein
MTVGTSQILAGNWKLGDVSSLGFKACCRSGTDSWAQPEWHGDPGMSSPKTLGPDDFSGELRPRSQERLAGGGSLPAGGTLPWRAGNCPPGISPAR